MAKNKRVPPDTLNEQRLDKWLWCARFYKTRSLAAQAISGGKVHLNGSRIKPSRLVKVADHLVIRREDLMQEISVKGLNKSRRPASEAVLLYAETQESLLSREQTAEQRRLERQSLDPGKRPNKKARRQIIRFKSTHGE